MAHSIFSRREEDKPKRILVPVKGAPVDDEAMRLAYTYALAKKGKGRNIAVDVVYVVEVPHALPLDAQLDDASVPSGEGSLVLDFPAFSLQGGSYDATVAVYDPKRRRYHEFHDRMHPFSVSDPRSTGGVAWMDHSWAVRPQQGVDQGRRSELGAGTRE